MPCCEKFQPKVKLDNNIFECAQCSKYAISCVCNAINNLPTKAISWKCKNFDKNFQVIKRTKKVQVSRLNKKMLSQIKFKLFVARLASVWQFMFVNCVTYNS